MAIVNLHIDKALTVVIFMTLVLFPAALVIKGLTHYLLLEAGVFLVSVKLIIAGYKSKLATLSIERQLFEINVLLKDRPASQT